MGAWSRVRSAARRLGAEAPRWRVLSSAAAAGGITGIRGVAGPAVLAHGVEPAGRMERLLLPHRDGGLERLLTSDAAARVLPALAAGEMLADKIPWIPARTDPLPLLGRAALGALVGAAVGRRLGGGALLPGLIGAAAAVTAAALATSAREVAAERLPLAGPALGLLEDVTVVAVGSALASSLD